MLPTNSILSGALEARSRNWSVMPVSRQKRPHLKWTCYQKQQPSEEEIRWFFWEFPNANVGLITGAISKVFVVETDNEDAYDYLISRGLPMCPEVQSSAEYKRHFYFKHPGFAVKNSASELFKGVDVRGDEGYAVLPPSIHKSGVPYQWIFHPDDVPLPEAPDWILERVARPQPVSFSPTSALLDMAHATTRQHKYAQSVFNGELSKVCTAPDGTKNSQLFKSCCRVGEFIPHGFYSVEDVITAFFQAVASRAQDKRHALDTIEKGIMRGRQRPARLPC